MNSESTQEHEPQWEIGQLALFIADGLIYPVEIAEKFTGPDQEWDLGVRIIDEHGQETAIAVGSSELVSHLRLKEGK